MKNNILFNTFTKYSLLIMFLLICTLVHSQKKETLKDVIILEFSSPYETMIINVDNDKLSLLVNDKTKLVEGKRKSIKKEDVFIGSTVDITFYIENGERILTKMKIPKSEENDDNFDGVFEILEEDIAYIDGRKVSLSDNAKIKCKGSKQCNCSKGRSFLSFAEIPIGSFLSVTGEQKEDGIFEASKITVCQNIYTSNDKQLMQEVSKSFDASNLNRVTFIPKGSFNPSYGLHKGNIKIGEVNYKILDNIEIQGYINLVGNRILPQYAKEESYTEKHNILFRFYVIDNDIPNALAFPNGMIFINTGLLKLIENEAQLAAVLGHEISHVTYEHGADRYKVSKYSESKIVKKGISWLKKKVKKKANIDENSILGSISEQVLEYTTPKNIINIFDKKKEIQSDRVGLLYMYNAGYDVREAKKFWQIMVNKTKDEKFLNKVTTNALDLLESLDGNVDGDMLKNASNEGMNMLAKQILETIYTSHPLSVKRLGSIQQLLSRIYNDLDYEQYSIGKEEFDKYLGKLKGN
ncbi:Beta-barrel assembly-enhancing protease [Kordia antarctica]|uniref:Beta-barrel assembly-enhancing protease n=1 Tax=Kordia antarctica TaxID=1218801 RepID=A0A7L4ZKF6_9FLAO|nr:M48 family metalloprotease [Kordia antarctica]QHI36404.1 Beta-barrel assembly-enhancing protease [Kordia antarctica]